MLDKKNRNEGPRAGQLLRDECLLFVYETIYKEKSEYKITEDELEIIEDVLLTKDNTSYNELLNMRWEDAQAFKEIVTQINKAQAFKEKINNSKNVR